MQIKVFLLATLMLCNETFAQQVGIGTTSPTQRLTVNGKLKIANDATTAEEGTIRWNSITKDFEGFTGAGWVSLTKAGVPGFGPGSAGPVTDYKSVFPGDIKEDKEFGFSVDIDSNYAIIGAPLSNFSGSRQGAVYIFLKQPNGTWIQQAKLLPEAADTKGVFGYKVSIFGEYAAISDYIDPDISTAEIAQVYIFKRTNTTWAVQTVLNEVASTTGLSNRTGFGFSIDLDSVHLVVGAPKRNQQSGDAFIYQREGTKWSSPVTLSHQTINAGSSPNFGTSVSIYKNELIVGSPDEADYMSPSNQLTTVIGRVYFYRKQSGVWNRIFDVMPGSYGNAFNPNPLATNFGEYVSLFDRFMIIAAPSDGAVFIYANDGSGELRLSYPNVKAVNMFENMVIILSGTTVYVHKRRGNEWNLYAYFKDPEPSELTSISMWGSEIITGVKSFLRCFEVNCYNTGKAFFATVE